MTVPDQQAILAECWQQLMDRCNVKMGVARSQAFAQLTAAYTESHRHYHNLAHIAWMLDICDLMRFSAKELHLLELATWYHDVVYDPHSSENETRSASFASIALRELGLAQEPIERVGALILMTKDHQAPAEDLDALIFLDADLSILQASAAVYAEYAQAIRQEYAWVPDREFMQGRRQVLHRFLQRPAIFRTERFREGEVQARRNLSAEVARIDELLRRLAP